MQGIEKGRMRTLKELIPESPLEKPIDKDPEIPIYASSCVPFGKSHQYVKMVLGCSHE